MSLALKERITEDFRQRYDGFSNACVVDVTRLKVKDVTEFRRQIRKKNLNCQVIKNSLARRAFKGTSLEPLGNALEGPCALITGAESAVEIAKTLVEAKKSYAALELKFAIVDGDAGLLRVDELSKMKGRLELVADVAGLILSPARRLAGCLAGPGGRIAGCLKAMAEKEGTEPTPSESP